ncbi:MAG: insulinase family protein [Burkholderiaceae bacterium]|jgi:zinc protease|nr:insulinase family protein [Burkholderiaceae bacterium]
MNFQKIGKTLALLFLLCGSAPLFAEPVRAHRLGNGMTILVREDHRAPVLTHMVWYRVGSMDEKSGTTGVAHVLEHMMFKGTEKHAQGEFSRIVASLGGRENAFTGRDYTAYFQQVQASSLEDVMALEADRMTGLLLRQSDYDKEIRVVMEERRLRTEDQPMSRLVEAVYATAFVAHPYRWPIIGWMNDLENMTLADVQEWYTRWYTPANATMVVVGDVSAEAVFAMAERYFGAIPARALPVTRPQTEPLQSGIRRVTVKAPAENPLVVLAFKVPALRDVENDTDAYALDVLAAVLSGYDNARLPARLVRKARIASGVSAEYDSPSRGPALFFLTGTPLGKTGPREMESRLRAEVARIAKEGVSRDELELVKIQIVASQIYKRDSLAGQAMETGVLEMTGVGHAQMDRVIEKLKQVTPQQVQAVAEKYFSEDALTVGTLHPLPVKRNLSPPTLHRH